MRCTAPILPMMSSSNGRPVADPAPADTRAISRGHLSIDQMLAIGRWLLRNKVSLPHGISGHGLTLKVAVFGRAMGWPQAGAKTPETLRRCVGRRPAENARWRGLLEAKQEKPGGGVSSGLSVVGESVALLKTGLRRRQRILEDMNKWFPSFVRQDRARAVRRR